MIKVAVLGKEGKTGQAVIARLATESNYSYTDELEKADLLVASPGIPPNQYPKVNIPIVSEIELAYRLNPSPVIAITGTNGKTTTTTLIATLLDVPAVGNIGVPYISMKDIHPYLSVEVSSYQLETIDTFKPHIAVLLNLTEDHLTRHGDMEGYALAKQRIIKNQTEKDYVIYNQDDEWCRWMVQDARSQKIGFTVPTKLQQDYVAARLAAKICGKSDEQIDEVFKNFKGVEHRMEKVGTFKGVRVVNDSKGTNVDSTVVALETEPKQEHIILIAGGRDKLTPLEPLAEAMRGRVKKVVILGEATARFAAGLKEFNQALVKDYDEAVRASFAAAVPGDLILLSPACASWDMFANFEERGKYFKKLVLKYNQNS
jgi:UDP-N-acetylmuramoylalanine--D-glutamate ligase